jgi:hypothetical protein
MRKMLILGLLLLFIACPKKEDNQTETPDVVDLLPLDNEISGWTKSSATQIAENESQLFDLINGDAPQYTDRGFVKCVFQTYSGDISGPVDLKLRIFDMGNRTNAEDIYDYRGTGSEIPWTDNNAGDEARYELHSFITSYYILDFRHDKFYIWIEINDGSSTALNIAKLFALNISQAIGGT